MLPHSAARWVLDQYPVAAACQEIIPLGNRGGFSGARLWRVETVAGPFCLRAWPDNGVTSASLSQIHRLMALARGKGLHFVPVVCPARDGQIWIEHHGRFWDLTEWLPGDADFHANPSPERLRAACNTLGRLHQAWAPPSVLTGPCPALTRRLNRYHRWQRLVQTGWRPDFAAQPLEIALAARRAWGVLQQQLPAVPGRLLRWMDRAVFLQPCLCDIWHDHVLFEGNIVTGIVDYGSVKIDNIAVDLGRLLGSLIGDDQETWCIGLAAYRSVRPLSPAEEELAHVLDWSGTLLALANWLTWLYHERRQFENLDLVGQRLEAILARVEKWEVRSDILIRA